MNFLNPWYLIAAIAAVVPLIIHLLHRQRARIEVFPSLEFLREMMRKRSRRFRLKQILLLVVRTLLVLFIALALARPTIMRGRAVRGHLPTTAAVILDDSFSMARQSDGGTVFESAKTKTVEILKHFNQSDEVFLLTASAPSRNLSEIWGTRDAGRLRERLGEVPCSDLATDMASPLETAVAVLARSANPNKEIYIISDMQKLGWEGVEPSPGDEKSSGRALVVDLGGDDPNACVEDIGFRIPSGSDDLELEVTFARFNSSESQGRVADVYLQGNLLGRSVFSPGESAREKETFRLPPFQGFLWGEIALAEDKLPVDDKRFFAVPSRKRTVGIVGDDTYIAKALSPEGGGSFTPVRIDEGAMSRAALARLDILIMSNVTRLSPLEAGAVADYLAGGGSLLIFLGSKVDVGDYNRNLLPLVGGGAAGGLVIAGVAQGGATGGFYTIERVDRGHRIFGKFKPDVNPFGDTRFYAFMKLNSGAGHVVAHFSEGSPALVELGDRVMVFASSGDVAWNDFTLAPQFLPILHEILLYLTSGAKLNQAYKIGDEVAIKTGERSGEAYLDGPEGSMRLFPETVGESMGYRIRSPREPGVYFLRSDVETLSVFAVNVDTRESDLSKVAAGDVASALKRFETRRVTAPDDVGESIAMLRQGRDLARPFLWAALVLLVVETLLASTLSPRFSKTEDQDALPTS
jgi:hypothetical protein